MLDHESRVLGELDEMVAEFPEPEAQVIGYEAELFLVDDPLLLGDGIDSFLPFDTTGEPFRMVLPRLLSKFLR